MLLGVKPGHACIPMVCLLGVHFFTFVAINHVTTLGKVVVMQDMVQHFNYHADSSGETKNVPVDTKQFEAEWAAAIVGRQNHPSIIQWDIFNEFEYDGGFQRWHCDNTSCPILEMTRRHVSINSAMPHPRDDPQA
jgi:hypothetical protein